MRRPGRRTLAPAALAAALALGGCGGSSGGGSSTTSATAPPVATSSGATKPSAKRGSRGGKPAPTHAKQPATAKNLAATDFSAKLFAKPAPAQNRFLPLRPGTQWVRQGFVNVGTRRLPHQVVTTVVDVGKVVDGVRTVAVLDQDTNGGQLAEQSLDWVAEDRFGNVWYLGSYTESYEGGQFVTASDAWLAGLNGSMPGILMPANPMTGTPPYSEDNVPGIEAPTATVAATGQSQCVPYRCYHGVLDIQEGSEDKLFAPGVGQIKTAPQSSAGKQELENLINLRTLSPSGLRQISSVVLKLDAHARTTAPTVFGGSKPAVRGA